MQKKKGIGEKIKNVAKNIKKGAKKTFSKDNLKKMGKFISDESKKPGNQAILSVTPIGKAAKVSKAVKAVKATTKKIKNEKTATEDKSNPLIQKSKEEYEKKMADPEKWKKEYNEMSAKKFQEILGLDERGRKIKNGKWTEKDHIEDLQRARNKDYKRLAPPYK